MLMKLTPEFQVHQQHQSDWSNKSEVECCNLKQKIQGLLSQRHNFRIRQSVFWCNLNFINIMIGIISPQSRIQGFITILIDIIEFIDL